MSTDELHCINWPFTTYYKQLLNKEFRKHVIVYEIAISWGLLTVNLTFFNDVWQDFSYTVIEMDLFVILCQSLFIL